MPSPLHDQQTNIHRAEAYVYADATARAAATGFASTDLGKLAYQQDNGTYWRLTATTPTWVQMGGVPLADPVTAAHGGTGRATLTAHTVLIGNGTSAVTLSSVGATNTVLHGNTGADPSYSAVVEADITLADNTTNNASTSNHGFLKKLDNSASHFMDGQGNWSTPSVSQNVVLLFDRFADQISSGVAGEEVLWTNNIPASASSGGLANNGEKVVAWYTGTLHVSGCTLRIYVNSVAVFDSGGITCSADSAFLIRVTSIRSGASALRTTVEALVNGNSGLVSYSADAAVTFSSTVPIDLRCVGGIIPASGDVRASAANAEWHAKA